MAHQNPSDEELKQLLTDATTISVVGVSSNPAKASYGIMQQLQTGIVSEAAAARARAGGCAVVMDACIGATHSLLGVPAKPRYFQSSDFTLSRSPQSRLRASSPADRADRRPPGPSAAC